ncbi:phytoene synthase [Aureimonas altamirensis DSM 21988]|uniref:Phytoene synthase n=1 Tax=Aureimonas altamirensis DSM 21988 TaxID=1121026 RepID=A0ABY1IHZ9_9HYPH|nr:phytoene/squalene synthase family protein [Aureimonas altamirensis]SHJ19769.1 phytoene synthase [Aureimonas altamirensis DSM 21988]
MSPEEIEAHAQAAIDKGSASFAAAARMFDRQTRLSVVLLYAWCRHCDDVIDGQSLGSRTLQTDGEGLERLAGLMRETAAALDGAPDGPAFAGLALVASRHELAREDLYEHLEGFGMDVRGERYETLAQLLVYCHRVAGVVGLMMARIMGITDTPTLARAADLGLAFQLTNIARDIVDDAKAGRVYVPLDWIVEEGLSPDDLGDPAHAEAVARLRRRLVLAAEPYYASARAGIDRLPRRSALAIAAAHGIYRRIGLKLVADAAMPYNHRVSTTRGEKLVEFGRAATIAASPRLRRGEPPVPPSPFRQRAALR